jgi:hypothetical protein
MVINVFKFERRDGLMSPRFSVHFRTYTLVVMVLVACLMSSCHGQTDTTSTDEGSGTGSGSGTTTGGATRCHTHIGTFTGDTSICKGISFTFQKCVDGQSVTLVDDVKSIVDEIAALGVTKYTQTQCDSQATTFNTQFLTPGCQQMGGKLKTSTKCDKTKFCADAVTETKLKGTCTVDTDCLSTSQSMSIFPPCCNFVKKTLKQRCSKYNEKMADVYVDNLEITGGQCRNHKCIGSTGTVTRATHVFAFLSVIVLVFVFGTS